MASIIDQQHEVLRLIRDATSAGKIVWRQSEDDADSFYTETAPFESYIHFKWPAYNGEEGSDRDFVDVGGAGRHMIGTAGWMLALEILAAGFDTWRDHVDRLSEQYGSRIQQLRNALDADS